MLIRHNGEPTNEQEVVDLIRQSIELAADEDYGPLEDTIRVETFADAAILSTDKGLVIETADAVFHVTVKRAR